MHKLFLKMSKNLIKKMNKRKVANAKMKNKKISENQLKNTNQKVVMRMKSLKKREKKS